VFLIHRMLDLLMEEKWTLFVRYSFPCCVL
jgi:hypothetical protein